MKKLAIIFAALAFSLTSCDAIFDNLEGDLTKMSSDDLNSSEQGLDRQMASLYSNLPMGAFGLADNYTPYSTETSGNSPVSPNGVTTFWNYTVIRDVNVFISSITNSHNQGKLSDAIYNAYLGEAYFVRAYYYFAMVRTLGGVPIITEALDNMYDGGENAGLYIPRSTEKETWDFVLEELDKAADLLPETRPASGAYRATKWSALGLKSRAALYAASVSKYWKNAEIPSSFTAVKEKLTYMEASYADNYYKQCMDASQKIISSGYFSLYGAEPKSVDEAVENLTDLFQTRKDCEWLFGKSYLDGVSTTSNNFDLQNSPNQARGTLGNVWKFASYSVTLDFADECDYYDDNFNAVDGTIKTRVDGNEDSYFTLPGSTGKKTIKETNFVTYDTPAGPFEKKDARFKAYVIYPDANFRNTTIKIQGGIWKTNGDLFIYDDSNPSETVNDVTYYGYGGPSESYYSAFYQKNNNNAGAWYSTGFGIRKFLDPTTPAVYGKAPWYDLRYTEILLNYCEAAAESNTNLDLAKTYLNQIRRRAFFQDTKEPTVENVLHERNVELAFEDDYAMTLARRRAYYNTARDQVNNPNGNRRHALLPVADLHNGKPCYIFVRANYFADDIDINPVGANTDAKAYYRPISNYNKNKITPNPSQE